MHSKLTATPIVDKNGKPTTVHKRTDPKGSATPKVMPAPAVTKQPFKRTKTPLLEPTPLTDAQRQDFREWQQPLSMLSLDKMPQLQPDVEALAWHVINEGRANHKVVAKLLDDHIQSLESQALNPEVRSSDTEKNSNPIKKLKAALRVADRLAVESSGLGNDPKSHYFINRVIEGSNYHPKQDKQSSFTPIETEEQLASLTAVTQFVYSAYESLLHNQLRTDSFFDTEGTLVYGTRMTNKSLEKHLMNNPDEAQEIIDYVTTRKPGTTAKDTAAIIEQVAEIREHGALGNGWL